MDFNMSGFRGVEITWKVGGLSPLHEPKNATLDFQVLTHFWFMGREEVKKNRELSMNR
jgi:hypothetical protein